MTVITDETVLRQTYASAGDVRKKILPKLDRHAKHFISLSPFVALATHGPEGTDCSPRGDAPGFVRVIDDKTLMMPDRRGNNLLDSLSNVLASPQVGLLFFVPGINETLRINGRARVVTDPALLAGMEAHNALPQSAMEITIDQVYFHCGRAILRGDLWNPEKKVERSTFPTLGRIIADQIAGVDADLADKGLADAYTRLG